MCQECGKKERTYDWIRDGNGKPKLTPNGSYVMQNENSAYYGFTVETIDRICELLNEIDDRPGREIKQIIDTPVLCQNCGDIVPIIEQDTHCG